MVAVDDNNVLLATEPTPEGDVITITDRQLVTRISRSGTTLWTNEVCNRDVETLNFVVRLSDGNVVVQIGSASGATILKKLNSATGAIIWENTVAEGTVVPIPLVAELTGDVYLHTSETGRFVSSDATLRRIRGSDGTVIWTRQFDALLTGTPDVGERHFRLANGNICVVGNTFASTSFFFAFTVTRNGQLVMSRVFSNASSQTITASDLAPDGNITLTISRTGSPGRLVRFNPNTGADANGADGVECVLDSQTQTRIQSASNSNPVILTSGSVRLVDRNTGLNVFLVTADPDRQFVPKVAFDSVGAIYTVQTSSLESDSFVVQRRSSVGALLRTALFTPAGISVTRLRLILCKGASSIFGSSGTSTSKTRVGRRCWSSSGPRSRRWSEMTPLRPGETPGSSWLRRGPCSTTPIRTGTR
jgi:outer membrane protein assembly factor BamB